jgi:type VI secretion system protein ImpK
MTNAFLTPAASDTEATNLGPRSVRRGRLALLTQEILTAATRFRTGRQVANDAEAFRSQVKRLVLSADEEGRRAGYAGADVKYALYAVIAFVDETVLNSGRPAFEAWAMRPLQDDIFGKQVAGEAFFQYLTQLMARDSSEDLADVLEVYLLCLLLGFRGRYVHAAQDALDTIIARVGERVDRIREPSGRLAPEWAPTASASAPAPDRWLRRLWTVAAALFGLWIVLFVLFTILLRTGVPSTPTQRSAATMLPWGIPT